MRVQIAARHCELPDSVRERTREHIERLDRYDPAVSAAEVVYEEIKHIKTVEVILSIDRADPVVATGEGEEFRSALDQVVNRLRRILRRRRGQLKDHQAPRLSEEVTSD